MEKRLITNQKYTFKYPYYATEDGRIYSSYSNKYICVLSLIKTDMRKWL